MKQYQVIIEHCRETGFFVGYIPGFAGAHSQGETRGELMKNMREVVDMLLEDGDPMMESEFVGVEPLTVG